MVKLVEKRMLCEVKRGSGLGIIKYVVSVVLKRGMRATWLLWQGTGGFNVELGRFERSEYKGYLEFCKRDGEKVQSRQRQRQKTDSWGSLGGASQNVTSREAVNSEV